MTDRFGREINYLRLSLTERCQQKCAYCGKSEGKCLRERELPTAAVLRIARVCASLGFRKIRFTGGEPLLRRDLPEIIAGVAATKAYDDIALTTNGQLLAEQARTLREAGLRRVNISLDSLDAQRYARMTGGVLSKTLAGIEAAFAQRLTPVKLNVVLLRGENDRELDDFLALARAYPLDLRFIELMPLGESVGEGVPGPSILAAYPFLRPAADSGTAPAVCYTAEGFRGRVGLINPMSACFCAACNRLRVTCDGMLRPCLGDNREISIAGALQAGDEALADCIREAILAKPAHNDFAGHFQTNRTMNRIGG